MAARESDSAELTGEQHVVKFLQALKKARDLESRRLFFEVHPDEEKQWGGLSILDGLMGPGQTIHAHEFHGNSKYAQQRSSQRTNRAGSSRQN